MVVESLKRRDVEVVGGVKRGKVEHRRRVRARGRWKVLGRRARALLSRIEVMVRVLSVE